MNEESRERYIKWIARRVGVPIANSPDMSYCMLMHALFDKEFYSLMEFDENREEDGLELRREYLGNGDGVCTVLEMMAGLAIRCASDILFEVVDASTVFWDMIVNLGLDRFTDMEFDSDSVDIILDRLLDREYDQDGSGGLFYSGSHSEIDMRKEEIWWQMQLYAIDKFDGFELY